MQKQKLELTWIGKDNEPNLEPRILTEDFLSSCGDKTSQNMLIHGDNLLALKALESDFTNRIRFVYIDPPFNTGGAFEHYNDGLEHSIWLSLVRDRLKILQRLIADNGCIAVHLDDNEVHYCKVVMDEIFGRKNFVSSIVWQKSFAKKNKALISGSHDTILLYAKDISKWQRNLISRSDENISSYKNLDDDPRGVWQSVSYSVPSEDSEKRAKYRYEITTPSGKKVSPPAGRHWNGMPDRTESLIKDNRLWFGPKGDRSPRIKVFLHESRDGVVPDSWWTHEFAGSNQDAKKEMLQLFVGTEPFNTPKPEKLLMRLVEITTNPGDYVLDSFLGSGTTCAVAHKMNRKWIGIERGEHCKTHCLPRMKKIICGEDACGVTSDVEWKGGGGFKYYTLAPSLLKQDSFGNWVIEDKYNADMLAAAVAKHEGFKYSPDTNCYWKQGSSTERDFIYTTTQFVTLAMLDKIYEEMDKEESLLICCKSFQKPCKDKYSNITLKKIPQILLGRCEFGKDDYSLNILTTENAEEEDEE